MANPEKIENFTTRDYVSAFERLRLTAEHTEMLQVHLSAPDHIITARHLALALGFESYHAANLRYGVLAGKVCDMLSVRPPQRLAVLVDFYEAPGSDWEWQLRPAVVEALIELGLSRFSQPVQEEYGLQEELTEGASFTVQVSAYERNPVARQRCIEHYGQNCTVCGFDFGANYGDSASGYIHVHHLTPVASIGKEYVIDPIRDLRPVCANCHAVIHLRKPPYSIEEVKTMKVRAGVA